MPSYEVNEAAVRKARQLIDAGDYDDETEWSQAAPSTEEGNDYLDSHGWEAYAQWHLGLNTDAAEQTKDRYHFPYGDFAKVNRAALIHAKQRASQNDHDEVFNVADELLTRLDEARGG